MKKIILLTVLLFATVQFTVAQNTIAKLKFEEAEELFTNEKYWDVVTKLEEVETILKSTNPKILHLKILAQSKKLGEIPYDCSNLPIGYTFSLIEEIRKNSNKYLIEYENLPDNEDKYREIYKVSEKYKTYPTTEAAFYTWERPLLQKYHAQYIKDAIESAKRKNNSINFIVEVTPENYTIITINEKQYSFDDLCPYFSGMTTEQQKNRCNTLIVQEDGSILYKGNVFLILENKRKAEYVKKAIKALHDLKYDK